jgi:hypothetical protein
MAYDKNLTHSLFYAERVSAHTLYLVLASYLKACYFCNDLTIWSKAVVNSSPYRFL